MAYQKFELLNPMRLSQGRIVQIAEDISRVYAMLHGKTNSNLFTINYEHVYDTLLYSQYGISLEEGDNLSEGDDEIVFGYYDIFTNTVALDAVVCDLNNPLSSKKAFTFWHEVGHAFLHSEWLKSQIANYPNGRVITTESAISRETSDRLEKQANLFASHAAAPTWFLNHVIETTFGLNHAICYRGPYKYQLYPWGVKKQFQINSHHELCRAIAYNIRHRFGGLSVEALTYRVAAESKWVKDACGQETPPARLLRSAPIQIGDAIAAVS